MKENTKSEEEMEIDESVKRFDNRFIEKPKKNLRNQEMQRKKIFGTISKGFSVVGRVKTRGVAFNKRALPYSDLRKRIV